MVVARPVMEPNLGPAWIAPHEARLAPINRDFPDFALSDSSLISRQTPVARVPDVIEVRAVGGELRGLGQACGLLGRQVARDRPSLARGDLVNGKIAVVVDERQQPAVGRGPPGPASVGSREICLKVREPSLPITSGKAPRRFASLREVPSQTPALVATMSAASAPTITQPASERACDGAGSARPSAASIDDALEKRQDGSGLSAVSTAAMSASGKSGRRAPASSERRVRARRAGREHDLPSTGLARVAR